MWFFMISCYLLSLITLLMLFVALFQSFGNFAVFRASPVTFMILISIVYLFTETLVIFFFVGTGVSIKEYTQKQNLSLEFQKASFKIKMSVYPPLLLNMLFMITLFILIGAVDTKRMAPWIYHLYFIFCIGHFCYAKKIQHQNFKDMTQNILSMSGIKS